MKPTPDLRTDEEAHLLLQDMRSRAATLFRALDRDGDGRLSPAEIKAAPEVLRALDRNEDGALDEHDMGGPTHIPGMVRRSGIVRVLDRDGDLVIGPDDIDAASERILMLDTDGDGWVSADDDLPPPGSNVEMMMPMGTPAQRLAFQEKLFSREKEQTGRLLPKGHPDVQDGYLLVQEVTDRGDVQKTARTFLMNDNGDIVHEWTLPDDRRLSEATVSYLLPDGNLLRTMSTRSWIEMDGQFPIGANGTIMLQAPDSRILWEWQRFEAGKEALHHDIELMPNGHILAICWDRLTADEAIALGWKQQSNRTGSPRERIFLDKLYEIKPDFETGGADIVWQWSMRDHLIQNHDPDAPHYGEPADHIGRFDLNWPQLSSLYFNSGQLLHTNSVSYNAEDDLIILSSAMVGEIYVIDHSTTLEEARGSNGGRYGKGGDFLWRWGNPQIYGHGTAEDQCLFWQHDVHWLTGDRPQVGDILLFNNGLGRDQDGLVDPDQICMGLISGAYSTVMEITLPRDETGHLQSGVPPTINWTFNEDGREDDLYSPFMSNAQRLPNGNTLMCEGSSKRIVEVTPDGGPVLDFYLGGPGRLYRVYKFADDAPCIVSLKKTLSL